jgi:SAM-dependent methyltransferase
VVGLISGSEAVIWHDVECAAYTADLEAWDELAAEAAGAILDLGCGTGRVALRLAEQGHDVLGLDTDPELVAALASRARAVRLSNLDAVVADARSFSLGKTFALAIAPMQVAQLLGGRDGRGAMLACVRRHLDPGGLLAIALADPFEGEPAELVGPPLPDLHEERGWVFSSLPIAVRTEPGATAIDRVRQAVSPSGELTESLTTISLDALTPEELEDEGRAAAFDPLPRRWVPPTRDYVGSTLVILRA